MITILKKNCLLILLGLLLLFILMIPVTAKEREGEMNPINPIDVTLSDSINFHISTGSINDKATITALNNQPEISSVYIEEIKVENSNDYRLVPSQIDFTKQSINDKSYNIKLVNENADLIQSYTKRLELKDYEYELSTGIHLQNETIQPGQIVYTLQTEWKVYQINYDLDGGTLPNNAPKIYNPNQSITLPEPLKQGYEFIGWKDSQTGETVKEILLGSYGDKNYIAQWKLTEFKITYDTQGGTLPSDTPQKYNSSIGLKELPIPTKSGYIFKGWSDGAAVQQKIKPDINNINGIIDESTGSYKISSIGTSYPRSITLTFELKYGGTVDFVILENTDNGLTVSKEIRDDKGEIVYIPTAYSNHCELPAGKYKLTVGYIGSPFEDKTTDIVNVSIIDNQINYVNNILAGSTGDKHFIAQWELISQHNISYNLNDGEFPLKPIYEFFYQDVSNYYDEYTIDYGECDLSEVIKVYVSESSLQDFTLYIDNDYIDVPYTGGWNQGHWISIPENLRKSCNLKLSYTGYEIISPGITAYKYDFLSQYTSDKEWELPIPTKEGYEFVGWQNKKTQEIIKKISKGTAEDLQLDAVWKDI